MRNKYELTLNIPEGVECECLDGTIKCKKGDVELKRAIMMPGVEVEAKNHQITFLCKKANKKNIAMIKTNASHVRNMFSGLDKKFEYELEIVHVHFPITVKNDNNKLIISNFIGEKVARVATILPGIDVNVKGRKITVSGHDLEKTGQTAANIEKATKISKRDRRVFQDGIYITAKPGGPI